MVNEERMVEVRFREGEWYPVIELIKALGSGDSYSGLLSKGHFAKEVAGYCPEKIYPKRRISEKQMDDWKHVFDEFDRVQREMRAVLDSDKGDSKAG